MSELNSPEYKCTICKEVFKNSEYKITQDTSKCILHCNKNIPDFVNESELNYIRFREKLSLYISKNEKNQSITFKNIVFPKIKVNDLGTISKELVIFKDCIFNLEVDFEHFNTNQNLIFKNSVFKSEVDFRKSKFQSNFICTKCTFTNKVNLNDVTFSRVTDFSETIFQSDINQKYTLYEGYTTFRDARFEKKLNLRDTVFYDKVNFLNIKKNKKNEIVDVENRETARLIKDSFEQQNNIIEANKFYALEMKEREKELNWGKNFFEKLVFTLHGMSSDHSQSWLLALFWIINLSFITSFLGETFSNETSTIIKVDRIIGFYGGLGLLGYFISRFEKIRDWSIIVFTFIIYLIYEHFSGDKDLSCFSKTVNPFSMMKGSDPISFGELIFKVLIAYLIYQLIISIRQNTRRK